MKMTKSTLSSDFLDQAKGLVLDEISNEQFGVSELANEMNMSRSSLLRKIKKHTGLSASQFIRNLRLDKAKELLSDSDLTISEISFEVGFSNSSYFIKCYREYFGHPPGEARKIIIEESKHQLDLEFLDSSHPTEKSSSLKPYSNKIIVALTIVIIAVISFYYGAIDTEPQDKTYEKSIAVLPFKNMSADSTNYYFVNGLMEASLNKLQKINDLKVKSRTSVEKYRNTNVSIQDIAEELNVNYLVEGSGQKIGEEVLLNIQLIDARTDSPIWTEQYKHKLVDIFTLQNTVAKKIALSIQASVTPEEIEQIDKKPTESLVAYDFYLKGLEVQQMGGDDNLLKSNQLFQKAILEDSQFALAYAQIAVNYFYLDMNRIEKSYLDKLNENADKALLYDSKSDLSLIAKALYYINVREFNLAIPHLEKALEYNPNSSSVVLILSDLYARAVPNTKKYLNYALKGVQLDIEANDSISKSFIYLTLSNALVQTGFVDEALQNINLSLDYNPSNPFAPYLKTYIELAKDKDLVKATNSMLQLYQKDTLRTDLVNEVAKLYYYQEKYKESHKYYEKFDRLVSSNGINMFPQEKIKMAIVYTKIGDTAKAQEFLADYDEYLKNDNSIYKPASQAIKYLYQGKLEKAMDQYKIFASKSDFQYWVVLFLEEEPLLNDLKSHGDYKVTMQKIYHQFWDDHETVKKKLKENGLI